MFRPSSENGHVRNWSVWVAALTEVKQRLKKRNLQGRGDQFWQCAFAVKVLFSKIILSNFYPFELLF